VMMMSDTLRPFREFISGPAIPEIKLRGQSHLDKQLQSAVNGRKPNVRGSFMHLKIYVLGT